MGFGQKVSELLNKYQRSQRWLAKASNVHYVTINRIVKGSQSNVTPETARKIARAIGGSKQERDELMQLAGAPCKWIRVSEAAPSIGAKVLAWHPTYKTMLLYYGSDGFYEAHNGKIKDVQSITHWMMQPDAPATKKGQTK